MYRFIRFKTRIYVTVFILVHTLARLNNVHSTYTSERCTYMFIPFIVHTMYVQCTDVFILFQYCINLNMYIHVQ